MKKKYDVSVIVPVYNVEKYIEKCLDSLVKQTLKSIQIIVVNDGSKDNSQIIIDKYVKEYPDKVFSYQKKNGGLSDARNYGVQYAQGEYIGFVDSDDWIDEKMYEVLFQFAKKENYQIVMCDLITINDGWENGHISKGYRGSNCNPEIIDFMINSLEPAHAWNKLYYYQLFEIATFPKIWYEDMATMPILISYAEKIGYLQLPLYYYRQREGSITQAVRNKHSLEVIEAWSILLKKVNQQYKKEIIYAIYKSIFNFIYFKPEYADEYLDFLKENKEIFLNNIYIKNDIKNGKVEDLTKKKLIPKKIHYFWFGNQKKDDLVTKCIQSWKRYAPDYEIIEWNETNCDIQECDYVKEAYNAKKWAFVADYFRVNIIYQQGGIYVDTDMEFTNYIDKLRLNEMFFPYETKHDVNACIFGSISGKRLLKRCIDSYKIDHLLNKDGTLNTSKTIVVRISNLLSEMTECKFDGFSCTLKNDIKLYTPNELIINVYDGKNIAIHHYIASWWDVTIGCVSYKYKVLKDFFIEEDNTKDYYNNNEIIKSLEWQIAQYENSTCWKITKPLRAIVNRLRSLRRK